MTQKSQQKPETDSSADSIEIETYGAVARSFSELLTVLSDEVRLRVSKESLRVNVVDMANVGTMSLAVDIDTDLESYTAVDSPGGEFVAGLLTEKFSNRVSFARKTVGGPLGDPVTLRFGDEDSEGSLHGTTTVTVEREGENLVRETTVKNVDKDSMRQSPETPDVSLPWTADMEISTLKDVCDAIGDTECDHMHLSPGEADQNGSRPLLITAHDTHNADEFRVRDAVYRTENSPPDNDGGTLLSLDYVQDFANAMHAAKMERLSIDFSEEFPVRFSFGRPEWGMSGEFMLAPRISNSEGES
jgi:hypothetical protein